MSLIKYWGSFPNFLSLRNPKSTSSGNSRDNSYAEFTIVDIEDRLTCDESKRHANTLNCKDFMS